MVAKAINKKPKNKLSASMWVVISVLLGLAMVPNGTAVKLLSASMDSASIAAIRYSIVAIILMTIFFVMLKKHKKAVKKELLKIILIAIPLSVGGPLYITAIAESSASYVSVLLLLSPIIFGILSMILTKDKVTKSAVIGILFAALGGSIVILLPTLLNNSVGFYGMIPLIIMAAYLLMHSAFPIVLRRENESGVPLIMVMALNYLVGAIACIIWAAVTVGDAVFVDMAEMNLTDWGLMAYLSIGFCVILRQLSVLAYEKTGTSTSVAVNYLGQVLAVMFPVVVIGETISWEMAAGAALIMVGIVLTRRHYAKHNHMEVHR
jgi:drug/metabolite transporter (DMT)-like permease